MIPSLTSEPISYLLILYFTFIVSFLSPSPTYVPIPPPAHQHTYLHNSSKKRTSLCGYTDGNFNHQIVFSHKTNISGGITGWQTLCTRHGTPMLSFLNMRNRGSEQTVSETTQKQQLQPEPKTNRLYLSLGAAVPNYHRLGRLNNKNVFSHSSADQKFEVMVLAGRPLSRVSSGESVPCFSASEGCQRSSASGHISPCFIFMSPSLYVSQNSLYFALKSIPVIAFKPYLNTPG